MVATQKSLLPPNASKLEKAIEASFFKSVTPSFPFSDLWNPGPCPSDYIPYLAWALGIEIWNSSWTDEEKRAMISKYVDIRRMRGTRDALKMAYEALGVRLEVLEWFEKDKAPFWFQVNLYIRENSSLVDQKSAAMIRFLTDRLKPLRSNYDLNVILTMDARLEVAAIFRASAIQKIRGSYGGNLESLNISSTLTQPIITKAGISAWGEAGEIGALKIVFKEIAIGSAQYDPSSQQISLKEEIGRFQIADSRWMEGERLHLTCAISGDEAFDIGEIGLYTETGILFAIQAKSDEWMARKIKGTDLLLSFDLKILGGENKIHVEGNGERLNLSLAGELAELSAMIIELQSERTKDKSDIARLSERLAVLEAGR